MWTGTIEIPSDSDDESGSLLAVYNVSDKGNSTSSNETTVDPFKTCNLCERVFASPSRLRFHMHEVHYPRFVKCPVKNCRKLVKDLRLKEHLRKAHTNSQKDASEQNSTRLSRETQSTLTGERGSMYSKSDRIGTRAPRRAQSTVTETTSTDTHLDEWLKHAASCQVCKKPIRLLAELSLAHQNCMKSVLKRSTPNTVKLNSPQTSDQNLQINRKRSQGSTKRQVIPLQFMLKITKAEMSRCPTCKIIFENDDVARKHYLRVHKRSIHECKYCDAYLSSGTELKSHIKRMHVKSNKNR